MKTVFKNSWDQEGVYKLQMKNVKALVWNNKKVALHGFCKPFPVKLRIYDCWSFGRASKHSAGFHRFHQPKSINQSDYFNGHPMTTSKWYKCFMSIRLLSGSVHKKINILNWRGSWTTYHRFKSGRWFSDLAKIHKIRPRVCSALKSTQFRHIIGLTN